MDPATILLYVKFGTELFELGVVEIAKIKALFAGSEDQVDLALLDAIVKLQAAKANADAESR